MLAIPDTTLDKLVLDLLKNGGVATLHLPPNLAKIHEDAFRVATLALDASKDGTPSASVVPIIQPNSNSASVTGYHSAGGDNSLSRYNVHREGFIFSNGELFPFPLELDSSKSNASFENCMSNMLDSMCGVIAKSTLRGIARHLEIEEDWFDKTYGPMETSSQWHVKRYVEPDTTSLQKETTGIEGDNEEGEEIEWLPIHTDPSLISVIIHDHPGANENAMGLEYQQPQTSNPSNGEKKKYAWKEVGSHGHAVATILCGSVMSYITGGVFQSAKHRVMYRPMNNGKQYRQAATLFLRPQGNSILTVPPSHVFSDHVVKIRTNCKFEDWLNRVSKNYQGEQKKEKGKKAKKQTKQKPEAADAMCRANLHERNLEREGKEESLGGELCELEESSAYRYTSGNATLRSSNHTLRHAKGRSKDTGPSTGNRSLPSEIRSKHIISYDLSEYNLCEEVLRMLREMDSDMIGDFRCDEDERLENFIVPNHSLIPAKKSKDKDAKGENAQRTLTDFVVNDVRFHDTFDRFVCEAILPHFKERLIACNAVPANAPVTFHYQRPPTLRIQPGPSTKAVVPHSDATYGKLDLHAKLSHRLCITLHTDF